MRPLREVVPAVTCTAQATLLTGTHAGAARHRRQRLAVPRHRRGALLAAVQSPAPGRTALSYRPAARGGTRPAISLRQAVLVVQPGRGGRCQRDAQAVLRRRRQQGVRHPRHAGRPDGTAGNANWGRFPFPTFWGPRPACPARSGSRAAPPRCCASERPDLTLVYLPHLDYDPQRFGPAGCDMPRLVRELDDACAPCWTRPGGGGAGVGGERIRPCAG